MLPEISVTNPEAILDNEQFYKPFSTKWKDKKDRAQKSDWNYGNFHRDLPEGHQLTSRREGKTSFTTSNIFAQRKSIPRQLPGPNIRGVEGRGESNLKLGVGYDLSGQGRATSRTRSNCHPSSRDIRICTVCWCEITFGRYGICTQNLGRLFWLFP